MNLRQQFEKETGNDLKGAHGTWATLCYYREFSEWLEEKADHDWQEYHEPLARIYREVGKALPDIKELQKDPDYFFEGMPTAKVMMQDVEISAEIENLLSKMIAEHELKMTEQ